MFVSPFSVPLSNCCCRSLARVGGLLLPEAQGGGSCFYACNSVYGRQSARRQPHRSSTFSYRTAAADSLHGAGWRTVRAGSIGKGDCSQTSDLQGDRRIAVQRSSYRAAAADSLRGFEDCPCRKHRAGSRFARVQFGKGAVSRHMACNPQGDIRAAVPRFFSHQSVKRARKTPVICPT